MKINAVSLSSKLVSNKWLLAPDAYKALKAIVNNYIDNGNKIVTKSEAKDNFVIDSEELDANEPTAAIINVNGILVKGCSEEDEEEFGLINTDCISDAIDEALADKYVSTIYFRFNSPGGETTGIEELGRKIAYAGTIKPTFGFTDTMACSAGYWLLSQCNVIGMTPSSRVGAVGVYTLITDTTEALKKNGILINAIYSGIHKLLGHEFYTLTDEDKAILQADVDLQHKKFKEVILSKRTNIDDKYMQGLQYEGAEALQANLVDVVVDDFDQFLTSEYNNMKILTKINNPFAKQAKTAPVTTKATTTKEEKDVVPGVPEDIKKEEEVPTPAVEKKEDVATPAVEKKEGSYGKGYVECPACKLHYELQDSHFLNPADTAKELDDNDEPVEDKDKNPKGEKDGEKLEKKAMSNKEMLADVSGWRAAFGQTSKPKNMLQEACKEIVNEYAKSIKK